MRTASGAPPDPWRALTLLCAAQFMIVLDFSIVNVALTSIQNDLGFTAGGLQWVVSAYAVTFGGFLLLGGRAADLFGRRTLFLVGMALFTLASVIAGLAWSPAVLIVARGVQGLGGAMVAPAVLAIIMASFPEGPERNRALGVFGMVAGLGFSAGMVLGGILTESLGWAAIFLVNVPIGLFAIVLTPRLIPGGRGAAATQGYDAAGAVAVTAGLTLLVYALSSGPEGGWLAGPTLAAAGGAAALIAGFVAIEARTAWPLVPLGVFRRRMAVGANLVGLLFGVAIAPLVYILSLYMQDVLGYGVLVTGLAFLPFGLTGILASNLAPRLVNRLGPRVVIVAGFAMAGIGLLTLLRMTPSASYAADLLPALLLTGFGLIAVILATVVAATMGVPEDQHGLMSGIFNTATNVGAAVGIALLVAIAAARTEMAAARGVDSAEALVAGFRNGLVFEVGVAVVAVAIALLTLPAHRPVLNAAPRPALH